jgi:hypothetical protein
MVGSGLLFPAQQAYEQHLVHAPAETNPIGHRHNWDFQAVEAGQYRVGVHVDGRENVAETATGTIENCLGIIARAAVGPRVKAHAQFAIPAPAEQCTPALKETSNHHLPTLD